MLNDQHRARVETEISHAACMLFGGVASVIEADELLVGSLKHWFAFLLDIKEAAESDCCPFVVPGQEFTAYDRLAHKEVRVVCTWYQNEDATHLYVTEVDSKKRRLCDWDAEESNPPRWEVYDV